MFRSVPFVIYPEESPARSNCRDRELGDGQGQRDRCHHADQCSTASFRDQRSTLVATPPKSGTIPPLRLGSVCLDANLPTKQIHSPAQDPVQRLKQLCPQSSKQQSRTRILLRAESFHYPKISLLLLLSILSHVADLSMHLLTITRQFYIERMVQNEFALSL